MHNLACDPSTLAGPIDDRVVAELSKRYPLDPDFLACMATCHGGQPAIGTVKVNGQTYRVAEFLTLLDEQSKLEGDFRPHFERTGTDERVVKSIDSVMNTDGNTYVALFSDIVPFAATETGMCLDRGYVDLFCFDYRDQPTIPKVVLWESHNAMTAYFEWESLPFDQQFGDDDEFLNVNWDSFLVSIADSFRDFVNKLQPNSVNS
ncbi:SMI1/KNR4 family protein [Thalassoroseus pseudoceratinae]|uniref:SMI1/KNR4 family protein n=1 Tax=Thalassoroseus pseudoceratinae TaxID=2713176 RepID=UPI00141FB83D|nr:SMI1/KNR4 family protein [Thalassoroseus pseudoceratinae]